MNIRLSAWLKCQIYFFSGFLVSHCFHLFQQQSNTEWKESEWSVLAPEKKAVRIERPLMVFPLLKELKAGWKNGEITPLLKRRATGTRSLYIDVGLNMGEEFFSLSNEDLKR